MSAPVEKKGNGQGSGDQKDDKAAEVALANANDVRMTLSQLAKTRKQSTNPDSSFELREQPKDALVLRVPGGIYDR